MIHIESPVRRAFTLGDFAVWQQPLSPTQIGPAQGDLIVYVNGERVTTNPVDIADPAHADPDQHPWRRCRVHFRIRARRLGRDLEVTSRPAAAQHLRDLALLRRVRDRIDREYAQPLDVEALARGVHMSAGHLSRQFRLAYGESPYSYLMTRRIERAMALLRRATSA